MKDVDINLLPTFLATKLGPIHLISKKFAGKLIIAQKIEESIGNLNDRVNKKSELMLMRRARAYSSSCSQIILVYLHASRRNSLFCSRKSLKTHILGVQGHSRSSMLTFLRSLSPVLVMISSMSVLICNHFHARQANGGKISSF